jgi:hypothetical protein
LITSSDSDQISQNKDACKSNAHSTTDPSSGGRRKKRASICENPEMQAFGTPQSSIRSAHAINPNGEHNQNGVPVTDKGDSSRLLGVSLNDSRICKHESGCRISASFNYPGQSGSMYCFTHRMEGMVHRKHRSSAKRTLSESSSITNFIDVAKLLAETGDSIGVSQEQDGCIMVAKTNDSPSAGVASSSCRKKPRTEVEVYDTTRPDLSDLQAHPSVPSSVLPPAGPFPTLFPAFAQSFLHTQPFQFNPAAMAIPNDPAMLFWRMSAALSHSMHLANSMSQAESQYRFLYPWSLPAFPHSSSPAASHVPTLSECVNALATLNP